MNLYFLFSYNKLVICLKISIENKIVAVDNYEQIIEISDALIKLKKLIIKGNNLKIKYLDKYRVVLQGEVNEIKLGE